MFKMSIGTAQWPMIWSISTINQPENDVVLNYPKKIKKKNQAIRQLAGQSLELLYVEKKKLQLIGWTWNMEEMMSWFHVIWIWIKILANDKCVLSCNKQKWENWVLFTGAKLLINIFWHYWKIFLESNKIFLGWEKKIQAKTEEAKENDYQV